MRSATIILIAFALIAMAFAADEAVAEEFSTGTIANLASDLYPSIISFPSIA